MASYSHFYRLQWIVYFLTQTLLYPCLIYGNSFLSTAKQAENLFCEKLYGDALSLYSQLFHLTQEKEIKVQWALRLASCHLEEKQPQIALNLLSSLDTSFYYNQKCFLMSLAHRQLGNSSQALYLLQQCTSLASEHANHLIALEQGYHLMQMGDFTQAQKILKSIINNPQEKREIVSKESNPDIITKKYLTVAGPEGQPIKISPKVATLIISADNEYPPKPVWSKEIRKWQKIMLSSTIPPTSANFVDMVQLAANKEIMNND